LRASLYLFRGIFTVDDDSRRYEVAARHVSGISLLLAFGDVCC